MRKYQDVVLAFDSGRLGYDNGTPVFRAQIRVERQDGTAAQLYSDNGILPLSQPVLTDSSGNFFFYVADGTYDIITSDPFGANPVRLEDVQIYDVAAIDAATGVIVDKAVSNAKLADMPTATLKGTAVGGVPSDLTAAQVAAIVQPSLVANATGTSTIVAPSQAAVSAAVSAALDTVILKSGGEMTGALTAPLLTVRRSGSAIEGGEIRLEKATTTALTGDLVIDVSGDRVRFFENGGTARGFNLNILAGGPGASSNILDRSNHTGTQTVATVSGLQAILDAKATPAYIKGVLGSRQAHVLDISDWDATGTNDMASSYQALINQAAVASVDVVAGPGKFLMGTTIVLPDGHSFRGKYAAGFQANPAKSSTFLLNHPSYGFTRSGSGGAAISIENQATLRPQPAVGTAAWTPGDYDFDYYFADISDLRMNHISTINPTRGIYFNGGRNQIKDWLGQCFKVGLQIDWSYDTCVFEDFHLWPTWNQAAVLKQYAQDHLVSMRLARVDNPFFSRIFSIWHQAAFEIGYFAGDGPNKPAGTVSKLKLIGADLDIGDTGYLVLPAANGHTAEFHGVTMQARDEVISSALLQIRGPNTVIGGDLTVTGSGGNGVKLESTATGSEIALRTRVETWNRTGAGFPGVEVMAGHFDLLPGSKLTGGNGAPNTSGNVTVWQP